MKLASSKRGRGKGAPGVKRRLKPQRLQYFAKRLQSLREVNNLGKQSDVAQTLAGKLKREVSQSLVAQLETGKVTNPDPALLKAIADVYQCGYIELVVDVITDKYDIDRSTAMLLVRDIRDVRGLAAWEKGLPSGTALWIAAPNFVDKDNQEVRSVVVSLLERDCKITYFVDERDAQPGQKFDVFLSQLSGYPQVRKNMPSLVKLDEDQLKRLKSSVVIASKSAFENTTEAVGYQIVNREGDPELGVRMTDLDTQSYIMMLMGWYHSGAEQTEWKKVHLKLVRKAS